MKKLTKRKMYHKRRKKEKADQRKTIETETTQTDKPQRPPSKYKCNNRQYYEKHNKHKQRDEIFRPFNSYTQGLQIWWHTYCTAIQYHTDQQKHWNEEQNRHENANDSNLSLLEKYANEYETSSDEEDEEEQQQKNYQQQIDKEDYFTENPQNMSSNAEVDDEYLKFLEITHKHREELKLKRAEEDF